MEVTFIEAEHLGGYVEGGDPKTWCPNVWQALIDIYNPAKVVDIGCGEGHALNWFLEKGLQGIGLEGIPQDNPHIYCVDFTKGPVYTIADLAWCCEFVEHVEEEFAANFFATFHGCQVVAMTHGLPGQPGYHHVNCQPPEYWIERMKYIGFKLNPDVTQYLRELDPDTWFAVSGLVFEKD